MKIAGLFLIVLCALRAQTFVAPLAGTVVDQRGRLTTLCGVMGNLLPPEYPSVPLALQGEAILSAAFNANGGALKLESRLALLDNQGSVTSVQPAPPGLALFSFSADGAPAWVFYQNDAELLNTSSGSAIILKESVVALGPATATSDPLLTNSDSQLWGGTVSIPDGVFSGPNAIPGTAPAAFFQSGWLTSAGNTLLWTPLSVGITARHIALPEPVRDIQMAAAAAVVINGQWLLNARFQLLEIPGALRPTRKLKEY